MAEFLNTAEALKEMVSMCEAAYARTLASAAAALKRGIKFKGVNDKPTRRKAVA